MGKDAAADGTEGIEHVRRGVPQSADAVPCRARDVVKVFAVCGGGEPEGALEGERLQLARLVAYGAERAEHADDGISVPDIPALKLAEVDREQGKHDCEGGNTKREKSQEGDDDSNGDNKLSIAQMVVCASSGDER